MTTAESLVGVSLRDGEYVVREVLGQGGMATVYRAYSRSLETDVALKVLAPHMAANLELRERFHMEARLLSRLFHPNLLTVHYFGDEGQIVYIAMRLVKGGTLRDRMTALGGTLDLISAARLVRGVADALQAAHDAQVVHLDVKPSNVLLGRADWPLLADTGIAEVIEPATTSGKRKIAGTPAYMSPEQCRGDAVDGSSDQYSLAVMAYELLTGRVPFVAPTPEQTLRQHVEAEPPRPRQFNPGLPSPVEDILLRGLAKDPADRFPSVAEFGRTLAEAAERTRGMSLETKTSLADAAPNIAGAVALLVLGPLLLMLLPAGASLAGVVPLAWPFQVALALGLAALAFGVRWHLVGMCVRAANAAVDAIERATGRRQLIELRRATVGSAEGVVNLLYVIGLYRLLATPILGLVGAATDVALVRVLGLVLVGAATVGALATVLHIARSAGLRAALIVLAFAWALTAAVASNDLGLARATSVISLLRLLVGAGIAALLLTRRRQIADLVGNAVASAASRLFIESRDDMAPASVGVTRSRLAWFTTAVLDLLYLLLGYALLRTPLAEALQLVVPPVIAAAAVTAVAGVIWLILLVRLQQVAGMLGALLALLLGAPLLLTLPILDGRLVSDVPTLATGAVAWVLGIALVLLLIGVRARLNDFGRAALGGRLDRRVLGIYAAANEDAHVDRHGAFGRLVGAFIDVGLLVLAYWIIGAPVADALVRSTGQTWIGAALLGALVAAIVGVVAVALLQTRRTLAETGGPAWRARATALAALCLLVLPLAAVGTAAVPSALANPAGTGALELQPARTAMLVVDWDFWLPWTPDQDQATYQLALSCTDGTRIGEFRETFRPAPGAPMPAGRVGALGPTGIPCDAWPAEYAARRQAAGLGNTSSLSWEALNVTANVNADGSVDVVESHRVTFTSGIHDHLAVKIGAPTASLSQLRVSEGDIQYAVDPPAPLPERYARAWQEGGGSWVGWWFPPVDSPAERTYTIAYRLTGAVRDAASARRVMNWRVLPPDPEQPIWMATLELRLPQEISADAVQLDSSGTPSQSGLLGGSSAWFTAAAAIAGQPLDASVDFPSGAPVAPPTPTPAPSATSTPAPTDTPTATPSPSPSASPTGTATETPLPTAEPEVAPTDEPTPGVTPSPATPRPTTTQTALPAETPTPVADTPTAVADTPTPTSTPIVTPTVAETVVVVTPTATDTPILATPTVVATATATATATVAPTDTVEPTHTATPTRTSTPTRTVTPTATLTPTATVTPTPTATPSPTSTPTVAATVAPSLQKITVTPAGPSLVWGQSQQMTATASFSDGTTRDVTRQATWRSSDPTTIAVNAAGVITAQQKTGTATISAAVGSVTGSTTASSNAPVIL